MKQSSITWFQSYLENRIQYTQVDGILLDPVHTSSSVSQGSIFGPLLFVCYINDLPKFCGDLSPFIYANDMALLVNGKSLESITTTLQLGLDTLTEWFNANKPSLNSSKTTALLFCGNRSPYKNFGLDIVSNGEHIESVTEFKYLGVTLDRHLTFKNHIAKIGKKVTQRTCILWKMCNYISQDLTKYLYLSLIHPIFTYCDFAYDLCNKGASHKLQVYQNAALRAARNCRYDYSSAHLHNDLETCNLQMCRRKSSLQIVYHGYMNQGPPSLNSMFNPYLPIRPLRSESQYLILPPKTKTKRCENDLAYRGCVYWNDVDISYMTATSIEQIKNYLKPYKSI